ncbi:hypothetical protein ACW23B_10395 [Streptomyces albidoflavus]
MNASAIPGHLPSDPYTAADDAAATLRALTGAETHDVALVMGSGWLPAADQLGPADHEFPVTELPGFPPPAVEGHAGTIHSSSSRAAAPWSSSAAPTTTRAAASPRSCTGCGRRSPAAARPSC